MQTEYKPRIMNQYALNINEQKNSHSDLYFDVKNHLKSKVETTTNKESNNNRKGKYRNSPTEASSLKNDYFRRGSPNINSSGISIDVNLNRYQYRDPRMQTLSGYHDQELFEKRYGFLLKMEDEEIKRLKVKKNAWSIPGRKGQKIRRKLRTNDTLSRSKTMQKDKEELKKILEKRSLMKRIITKQVIKCNLKKKKIDNIKEGKSVGYYINKREHKKFDLGELYDELKRRDGNRSVRMKLCKKKK